MHSFTEDIKMGYRSEVAIAVSTEDYNNAPQNVKDAFYEMFDEPEEKDDIITIYHKDWVKWYDDYKDVQTIESWLNSLNSDNYGMIRIGEEDADVEYLGDPWQNGLSMIRKISF